MEYVLLTTMIVGIVELVTALFDRNYRTATIVVCAALVGAVCGYFGVEGLDVATGIAFGLGASGVVTVAKKV